LFVYLSVLVILFYTGCSKNDPPDPLNPQAVLEKLYEAAVGDAITADSSEICDTLWPINSTNTKLEWKTINNEKYVLVGNFNKYPDSYADTSVKNSWGIIWVFIPDQFKCRMKSAQITDNDTLLRMSQMLGLDPGSTNNYFVELWVRPVDLYRPAADPEIDDNTAGQYLPANSNVDYAIWFNQQIYDSYFVSGTHYPWTRLGYTFDWASPASEVGVSEYCIKSNSLLFVKKLCPAKSYLKN
ncbi:MAG: hypothetical protein ACOYMF_17220, partial [Bacteroidales bacterium]